MTDEHNEYRLIAIMHDNTVIEKDYIHRYKSSDTNPHWLSAGYETVQMANFVICVHLKSGCTEVIKNRYGDTGPVARQLFIRNP